MMPPRVGSDAGTEVPEDPVADLKKGTEKLVHAVKEAFSGNFDPASDLAKQVTGAGQWTAQAVKESAAGVGNVVNQASGNARDDVLKEAASRREPEHAGAMHTETGGMSRAETRESMVKAGLASFIPEAGSQAQADGESVELRGLRRNVESGHGPNTQEDLQRAMQDPDQLRGDTLPDVKDGSQSPQSRVGGQNAGTVKPAY